MTYRCRISQLKASGRLVSLLAIVLLTIPHLHAKLVVNSKGLTELNGTVATQSVPYNRSVVPTQDGVIVTYSFNYFEATKEGNSYRLSAPGFYDVAIEGSPALLKRRDAFECPANASPTIKVLRVNHTDVKIPLSSSESPISDSGTTLFPPNTPITPYGGFLPQENVYELRHQKSRFESMVWVNVSPFMYSVRDSIIRLCTELSYEIAFNTPASSTKLGITFPGITLPDSLISPMPGFGESDKALYTEPADEEFLIITVNKYAESNALQSFASWKRIQGYNTSIASRETWGSSSRVMDTIKAHYSANTNLRYILLVGDAITVPSNYKRIEQPGPEDKTYRTDLDYGCMNENSFLPDIRRGRWAIRSLDELETVVVKTIDYEANPPSDREYYSNATHLAFFQNIISNWYSNERDTIFGYADQPFDRNCEDVQSYMEKYHNIAVNRLYSAHPEPRDTGTIFFRPQEWSDKYYSKVVSFDTVPLFRDFEWDKSFSDFVECLKTPQLYSLYRGHGSTSYWSNSVYRDTKYEYKFTSSNVRSLSSQLNTTALFSLTCLTGDFYADCFANAWLSSPGGPVAVIAQSSIAYTPINGVLTMELFNHWFGGQPIESDLLNYDTSAQRVKKSRIGDILDYALSRVLTHPMGDYATYTNQITHCFADPSLILHNTLPQEMKDVDIIRKDSRVSVYTGNLMGNIGLYDMRTKESRRFYGNGASIKTEHPENVCIYIEKDGYYPYLSLGENVNDEPAGEENHNRIISVYDTHGTLLGVHYTTDESMGNPTICVFDGIKGELVYAYQNQPKGESNLLISRPTTPGYYQIVLMLPELSKAADVYGIAIY